MKIKNIIFLVLAVVVFGQKAESMNAHLTPQRQFAEAIMENRVEEVRRLVNSPNIDIEAIGGRYGLRALSLTVQSLDKIWADEAAAEGERNAAAIVKILIDAGVDVNRRLENTDYILLNGKTVLEHAIERGRSLIVKELMQVEEIDTRTKEGKNSGALERASYWIYPRVTKELLLGSHHWTYEELKTALGWNEYRIQRPHHNARVEEYQEIKELINKLLLPYNDLIERRHFLLSDERFSQQNREIKMNTNKLFAGEFDQALYIPIANYLFNSHQGN